LTADTWTSLYLAKVLSLATLGTQLEDPTRAGIKQAWTDVWGAGGCFAAPSWAAYSTDSIDLQVAVDCYTGTGYRLQLTTAADHGFHRIPYINDGTVRYLAARYNEYPAGAEVGIDGSVHYSAMVESTGELIFPSSVTKPTTTTVRLKCTGTMQSAAKWTNMAESRPVVCWLVTPVTASSQAVYAGSLVYDGVDWYVDVPHTFGQAVASVTAANYRVLVTGLSIGSISLVTDLNYVFLGTAQNTGALAFVVSGVSLIDHVSSWITAYKVEHNSAGHHTTVTGTSATWTPGTDNATDGTAPGVVVKDHNAVAKAQLLAGSSAAAGGGGVLRFPRPDLASDGTSLIDAGPYNGQSILRLTNSHATAGNAAEIVHDGVITKDVAKSAAWKLRVNSGADQTLVIDNAGAGKAHLDVKGLVASRIAGGGFQYGGSVKHSVNRDVSPPFGGWAFWTGPGAHVIDMTGAPPYSRSSSAIDPITLLRPLEFLQASDSVAGTLYTITNLKHTFAFSAGNLSLKLRRAKRDGTGAAADVNAFVESTNGGVFGLVTHAVNHDVDPLYAYWLELLIDPNAASSDVKVSGIVVQYDKTRAE
jgi:hypothetical protein